MLPLTAIGFPLLASLIFSTARAHRGGGNRAQASAAAAAAAATTTTTITPAAAVEDDWLKKHMASEHHLDEYDDRAAFALHVYDGSGVWTPAGVLRTYGLEDPSTEHVPAEKREEVTREVFRLFDEDRNGLIEEAEWLRKRQEGVRLPDFGIGLGIHADFEEAYEIHHFELYHDENTKEEDLTHPEDIEHFRLHELHEKEMERLALMNQKPVNEANIPAMFRRH